MEKVDHQNDIKDKELDEVRLSTQQHETKIRSMLQSIKELGEKKNTLEQTQDLLNEELVKLRAQPRIGFFLFDGQKKLAQQIEQISKQRVKQVTALRSEIRARDTQMEILKE